MRKEGTCKLTWDAKKIQDLESGTIYKDQADILISATGSLNNWKWPDIPGLHDFKGKLMHSARWDESYDYTVSICFITENDLACLLVSQGKRVSVIGNGSSGIQIVPGMLPKVAHIDHYIRGRTWVSPTFGREEIDKRGTGIENCRFSSHVCILRCWCASFIYSGRNRSIQERPPVLSSFP